MHAVDADAAGTWQAVMSTFSGPVPEVPAKRHEIYERLVVAAARWIRKINGAHLCYVDYIAFECNVREYLRACLEARKPRAIGQTRLEARLNGFNDA